jgi:hypothetical protein
MLRASRFREENRNLQALRRLDGNVGDAVA